MVDERTDEQLMTRVKAGDVDAFGELVERHHQRALNFAYRLTGDAEMARDIAQESFLRILKAAGRYQPRARFTTYLFTVVRNTAVEAARRAHRRFEVRTAEPDTIDALAPASRTTDAPDAMLERDELHRRLRQAMASLPAHLREAFVLTEVEGFSYREAAEICECPEGTVASRKHSAVERLRTALESLNSGDR
jgi:RNA polymerase sigma-70 factor (ECF subfamily)